MFLLRLEEYMYLTVVYENITQFVTFIYVKTDI